MLRFEKKQFPYYVLLMFGLVHPNTPRLLLEPCILFTPPPPALYLESKEGCYGNTHAAWGPNRHDPSAPIRKCEEAGGFNQVTSLIFISPAGDPPTVRPQRPCRPLAAPPPSILGPLRLSPHPACLALAPEIAASRGWFHRSDHPHVFRLPRGRPRPRR